jgi:hypothetical protein
MTGDVAGTVDAYWQASFSGLPNQLLGDPFGLSVAVLADAG